jgi:hypothetical protein
LERVFSTLLFPKGTYLFSPGFLICAHSTNPPGPSSDSISVLSTSIALNVSRLAVKHFFTPAQAQIPLFFTLPHQKAPRARAWVYSRVALQQHRTGQAFRVHLFFCRLATIFIIVNYYNY